MTGKTTFDPKQPHATVHGDPDSEVAFEQNGQHFDSLHNHIGAAPTGGKAKKAPAPERVLSDADIEAGKGNLAHGQIPVGLKPLEEGGGGGGETLSDPIETSESKAAKGKK